jgi:hypothetical protein
MLNALVKLKCWPTINCHPKKEGGRRMRTTSPSKLALLVLNVFAVEKRTPDLALEVA